MKYSKITAAVGLCIVFLLTAFLQAQPRDIDWEAFSVNLVKAIKSGNPGLQQSAMQRIIQYADNLDVENAVYDLGWIFRFDDNPRVRRMAMVTLHRINSEKAIQLLARYMPLEEDSSIKKQCCSILNLYIAGKNAEKGKDLVADSH